jgi:hypothetical protein
MYGSLEHKIYVIVVYEVAAELFLLEDDMS